MSATHWARRPEQGIALGGFGVDVDRYGAWEVVATSATREQVVAELRRVADELEREAGDEALLNAYGLTRA